MIIYIYADEMKLSGCWAFMYKKSRHLTCAGNNPRATRAKGEPYFTFLLYHKKMCLLQYALSVRVKFFNCFKSSFAYTGFFVN